MVIDLALGAAFLSAVLGGFALRRAFFLVRVAGPSMEPALRAGDRLLVRRVRSATRCGDGSAVSGVAGRICVVAEDDGTLTVKRVAAIPGDPVPDDVPALRAAGQQVVPAGHLVLLGDNRAHSHDSRSLGYYRTDQLLGIVSLVVRPVVAPAWRGRLLAWQRLPTTTCGSR